MSLKALEHQPRDVQFESQAPQETLYFLLRRHPVTNVWWIVLVLILILTPPVVLVYFVESREQISAIVPPQYQAVILIVWYLVTLFLAFESFLLWYFNVYIITDQRVIDVDFFGLWKKRISEASLGNVEDATYETTGIFHVMLNYGNIFMQTAAENPEFGFLNVPKPGIVHDKLTDLVEDYKKAH